MTTAAKPPTKYAYRSYWVDGEVRRDYLGTMGDPVTRVLVQADGIARASRKAESNKSQAELDAYARVEPCARLVSTESGRLVRQLRLKHERDRSAARTVELDGKRTRKLMYKKPDSISIDRDSFDELVDRAEAGSEEAIDDLKRVLRGNPGIYQVLGDLGRNVQMCLIDVAAPDSVAMRESLRLKMDQLRSDLLSAGKSPVEKLLVEQVVVSTLDVAIQQIGFCQPHSKQTHKRRWEQQLDRAQKRHLAAVRSLAEVRQMLSGESN